MEKLTKFEQALIWKRALINLAPDAIDYFMPDLAAEVDKSREIRCLGYKAKALKEYDVILEVPVGKHEFVTCLIAQHFTKDEDIGARVFEIYVRLRGWRPGRTTVLVIYLDESEDINSHTESMYGVETTLNFKTYHLLKCDIEEVKHDKRAFARIIYPGRMAHDIWK
jgi:hypothetical protein